MNKQEKLVKSIGKEGCTLGCLYALLTAGSVFGIISWLLEQPGAIAKKFSKNKTAT